MTIEISTAVQLQAMQDDLTEDYILVCDIDASDTVNWNSGLGFVPVGEFTGTFDGQFFKIKDLFIDRTIGYAGLFSIISGSAEVQNVWLEDVDITAYLTGTTCAVHAGALIGYMLAGLVHCIIVTGSVSGTSRDTGGIGHSHVNVGGAIGYIYGGTIRRAMSYATVAAIAQLDSAAHGGGLVGLMGGFAPAGGDIQDSCARGNVTATYQNYAVACAGGLLGYHVTYGSIDNCYSTGVPSGQSHTGGLVGRTAGTPTNTNSFWDKDTSGLATSDGGTGKTTAQMKNIATFVDAGWDFATPVWKIRPEQNNGYPYPNCGFMQSLLFPTDPVARVSGIRRVYRPGLYRMELNLGDIGFAIDVSSAGFSHVPEVIEEPEVPGEEKPSAVPAGVPMTEADWAEVIIQQVKEGWIVPNANVPGIGMPVGATKSTIERPLNITPENLQKAYATVYADMPTEKLLSQYHELFLGTPLWQVKTSDYYQRLSAMGTELKKRGINL